MKCLKRAKDSDSEDNFPKDNVNETCESDIEMEKDEVSIETACNSVEKSLELFDCSPLKNVKSDGTLQNVKRKISSVTSAFTKTIAIALVELVLDQKALKNFMAPFYGWGSTASRLEPLRGGSLLFTTKFPEVPGTHFIDLERMKG